MARNMRGEFFFGGVSSCSMGIWITKAIEIPAAAIRQNKISIPGRSGDLIIYDGGYDNVSFSVECCVRNEAHRTAAAALEDVKRWINGKTGYQRFELPGEDGYRMACISSSVEYSAKNDKIRTFAISFDCKPQVYTYEGENAIHIKAPTTMYNVGMEALPLITLYGNSGGILTVGDVKIEVHDIDEYLALDCEMQDAYKDDINKNSTIYAPTFPKLSTGENKIAFSGGISCVEIVPRWWHL